MENKELLVSFPLHCIRDMYEFRFEGVEPAIDDVLQETGNGICDYGFCDEEVLNMIAYVNEADLAVKAITKTLRELQTKHQFEFSIWNSVNGVKKECLL
ncbi:MAG TPA: hypothetical protein VGF30_14565 [Bacteroidia bacterium]